MRPTKARLVALGRGAHLAPHAQPAHLLLGHREVHEDRVQRLQRHHGIAACEVLPEVDLPDPEHPPKGARMVLRSMAARISPTRASAVLYSAEARS
jgi:hypothetical protein